MEINKIILISMVLTPLIALQGCSTSGRMFASGPDFELRGSAEGIESFYQGHQGVVETAKNPEGKAPSTHDVYKQKEYERTKRSKSSATSFGSFLGMGKDEPMDQHSAAERRQLTNIIAGS